MSDGWRSWALCAETGGAAFFPEGGEPSGPAKSICRVCPVKDACLTDALDTGDVEFGVRGALTAKERRELLKRRNAA